MKGRELAIAVAEKCGDQITPKSRILFINCKQTTWDEYLHDKAGKILLSEGMAGKIEQHFFHKNPHDVDPFIEFYSCYKTGGTLAPHKILEVWLEIDK